MTPYVVRVAVCGVRFKKQAKAYKEANPQMCVRIIAFKRTRVMYTYNSRCYPWEDKKQ